jgi:anti-sigma regulatory factor (Ser/Thr protein kinase)
VAVSVAIELEPEQQASAKVRQILRERISDQVPATVMWDLLTVVTELVTNSVVHGPGDPIQIRITVEDDGSIRGEVEDQGDGEVALRDMVYDGPGGGAGLHIVEALTDRWAVYEGSTHVWFEIGPAPSD